MLSSQAIHEEITNANKVIANKDATTEEILKSMVKLQTLELKLLHNMRTNQTMLLEHYDVKLKEPKKEEER